MLVKKKEERKMGEGGGGFYSQADASARSTFSRQANGDGRFGKTTKATPASPDHNGHRRVLADARPIESIDA